MEVQRIAAIGAVLSILLAIPAAPATAQQRQRPRAECVKLTQQIARYSRDAEWAEERDNELWEASNLARVEHLSERREKLCPEYRRESPLVPIVRFLDAATRAATRYFLGGL